VRAGYFELAIEPKHLQLTSSIRMPVVGELAAVQSCAMGFGG
jgi:hypothetical protein